MSYLGYTGLMTSYCSLLKSPSVLEIGVDRGQTALPLLHNLSRDQRPFKWIGVDVRKDWCLFEQIFAMVGVNLREVPPPGGGKDPVHREFKQDNIEWNSCYLQQNSLEALPALVREDWKFDLVLIDGDHNYATVSQELNYIKDITYSTSLVFVDDYSSRWSEKDLYYKDRDSHSSNNMLSKPAIVPGKVGVKQAVDDWISDNPKWACLALNDCAVLVPPDVAIALDVNQCFTRDLVMQIQFRGTDRSRLSQRVIQLLEGAPEPCLIQVDPIGR